MTVDGVLDFLFQRIYPKDAIFRISATILTSDWAALLLRRDLLYFLCDNIDFRLGRPYCPVLRVPSSVQFQTTTVTF